MRKSPKVLIVDSRAPGRYRVELEVLDPIAGLIPGAVNTFNGDNFTENGHFKSKEQLRACFEEIFGNIPAEQTVSRKLRVSVVTFIFVRTLSKSG
jgi:thiosulfate/3-mercaptopyruvate sulfurtransferase